MLNNSQKWYAKIQETENKWNVFINKLAQRADELGNIAIQELKDAYNQNQDVSKEVCASLIKQFNAKIDKVNSTYENSIDELSETIYDESDDNDLHEASEDLRDRCSKMIEVFEGKVYQWIEQIENLCNNDPESKYYRIIEEYEAIEDTFRCKQCDNPIQLGEMYFAATNIACVQCKTRNTFQPNKSISSINQIGEALAEHRTKSILNLYNIEKERAEDIYLSIHELELELDEDNRSENKIRLEEAIATLKNERLNLLSKNTLTYEKYLEAKFSEWIKLVPTLAAQHKKDYQDLLEKYRKSHIK